MGKVPCIVDIVHPNNFNNREMSWLDFNKRVLQEANDFRNPLLERLKFLSIFSSNLDEFFMVRVASLQNQWKAGYNKPENKTNLTPVQQLKNIHRYCHQLVSLQDAIFHNNLIPRLREEGIEFLSMDELNHVQYTFLSKHFNDYILPTLTPMAVDTHRPFPLLLSKSLNLAIRLKESNSHNSDEKLAIVQVPSVIDRVIKLPTHKESNHCYVLLEDVIAQFLHRLFNGLDILSVSPFRITKNADFEINEEGSTDLLKEMESEIKKMEWGSAVRLEVINTKIEKSILTFLTNELELSASDIYLVEGPIDYTFLTTFTESLYHTFEHLFHEAVVPQPPKDLIGEENIFNAILKKDILLHHPYESFKPVIDFIETAAEDPYVLAIKQTLYRVSGDSPIIKALMKAASAGKQVTVLVELKARFEEEKNIQWAKMLERAGAHVIYGITGLKTHSKITLIIKEHQGIIQRFVHLGTGNYNDSTAKFYTDMGLFTADESFCRDATLFFNHLSGYSKKPEWSEFTTAPFEIRERFIELIEEEIKNQRQNKNGRIIAKMNSLTDKAVILKLYEASNAGVRIDLIIRGICCLKPGLKGISENITVRSIVGRFLEHSRIFYFHQNGYDALYLSSADWMTRNMEKRIEILFPIYRNENKERILEVLRACLKDNIKARYQLPSGEYQNVDFSCEEYAFESQVFLYEQAKGVKKGEKRTQQWSTP